MLSVTDGLGGTLRYVYDNGGHLTEVIDQTGISTRYIYDNMGNKIYMIDGRGKVTEYTYGSFGLLIAVTDADNQTIEYGYDLAKNMTVMLDRMGRHTRYEYENQQRLLHRSVDETGDTIAYTYDAIGNRTRMTDISGVSEYQYDENQRLISITKDGSTQIGYTYDKIGNVLTVTDSQDFTTTYTYDQSSRMNTVSFGGHTTTYSYDENGNRIAVIYEGGVSEAYTFDRNNRLITLSNQKPNGSVVSSYSYTYDIAGRQATKSDSFGTTNYTYDAAGRIMSVEMSGKTTIYAYDKAGNRLSLHETYVSSQPSGYIDPQSGDELLYAIKKSEYLYSSTNELLSLNENMYDNAGKELIQKTVSYLYDDNGNEIRQRVSYLHPHNASMRQQTGGNPYGDTIEDSSINTLIEKVSSSYDGFNRLISRETIKAGVRSTVEFVYDGDNLRTEKKSRSSKDSYVEHVTRYLYDRQYVILETDATGVVQTRYINGLNYIARIDATSQVSYYLFNGHGDVVHTVSETGEVENTYDYDIFGSPILTIESYANAIRYAGEFYDEESGLYYLRARYYDSYIGRFISEDSYWGANNNPLSLNRYTYTHNDPINFWDPTGHWEQGDERLSSTDQRQIMALTDAYISATNKADRDSIRQMANDIRTTAAKNNTNNNKVTDSFSSAVNNAISTSKYIDTNGNNYITADTWRELSKNLDPGYMDRTSIGTAIADIVGSTNSSHLGNSGPSSGQSSSSGRSIIIELLNWYSDESPMDNISEEDYIGLTQLAKEKSAKRQTLQERKIANLDRQIDKYDREMDRIEQNLTYIHAKIMENEDQQQQLQSVGVKIQKQLARISDLKIQLEFLMASSEKVIETADAFLARYEYLNDIDLSEEESEDVVFAFTFSLIGTVADGFWDTIMLAGDAIDDPKGVGKNTLNQLGVTAVDIYNVVESSIQDPKGAYEKAAQSVENFADLSAEEQAAIAGTLIGELVQGGRTKLLPDRGFNGGGSGRNNTPDLNGEGAGNAESKIFSANGNAELRATRRPAFDNWMENGVQVNGQDFKVNQHAYNSLFKSGRKDIMPDDITTALGTKPTPGTPGSVVYTNPSTGTNVYVNPTTQEIVGVQPGSFK